MKRMLTTTCALLLLSVTPALAHRTDEYLQATTILLSKKHLQAEMRLTPGTAVAGIVLDSIDTNRDTTLSEAEQRTYAERVLHDVSVTLDKASLSLELVAWRFPTASELRSGTGEIQIDLEARLPTGGGDRKIMFENKHRPGISAYLVNSLVPQDTDIEIVKQNRNYVQSLYEVRYVQHANGERSVSFGAMMRWALVLAAVAVVCIQSVMARRTRVTA